MRQLMDARVEASPGGSDPVRRGGKPAGPVSRRCIRVAWSFLIIFCLPASAQERRPEALTAILGAMPVEVQMLEARLQDKRSETFLDVTIHTGVLNGRRVALAASGIGKVNAAKAATLLLDHFRPSELVFTGVAGGLGPSLAPGDIVIGEKTAQHDYGEINGSGFQAKPVGPGIPLLMPAPENLVALAEAAALSATMEKVPTSEGERLPHVIRGVIVTGDVFVASPVKTAELRATFQADAVEMEGAAVAQICWEQKVPCLVLRCVSDKADATAGVDFARFARAAATNSARLTLALVERLGKTKGPGTP